MEGGWKQSIVKEVKKQLYLSGPLIAIGLFQYSLQLISITFVGHHGELALSAASLATSFASVTGFALIVGVGTALDTLCGQSFGAEQYHMLGVYSQRAMLVVSIINIFIAIIWANTKHILIAVHQDATISREAGQYILFMIPGLFAHGLLQCLIKFFQTQNRVCGMMLLSGITSSFHAIVCLSLVFKSGLSIRGAALAISVSYWLNVLLLAFYIKFSASLTDTWTGFSIEAMHNIFSFIRISIPSALMPCLKVWSFELMIFLSGLLPNPKLETSVLAVCFNTAQVVWVIPFGLSAAVSTRVSNELGAGRPKAARVAANVGIFMAIAEGLIVALIIVLLRNVWGRVFSNEKGVVKYVETMVPIVAASSFLDGNQTVLSGIARGCGWKKIGAWINLGSYYLVGLPVASVFAFVLPLKAKGLWLGIVAAFSVQILLFIIITIRGNWEKQANKAAGRVNASNIPVAVVSQG
ncbi:hypothetical protein SLEP1_g31284 [Rubroshorea leprosula]|uniref:Protein DETOXIFICATION n=1 Tax=Rubroshorea leprosula TaxID=152421 RepID=A0AAV5K815_9ROSI|nr:hypothetical protein SLEP1_g31284 [Rubroshorea leprosula]